LCEVIICTWFYMCDNTLPYKVEATCHNVKSICIYNISTMFEIYWSICFSSNRTLQLHSVHFGQRSGGGSHRHLAKVTDFCPASPEPPAAPAPVLLASYNYSQQAYMLRAGRQRIIDEKRTQKEKNSDIGYSIMHGPNRAEYQLQYMKSIMAVDNSLCEYAFF
jgi:hypothetical protein